MHQKKDAQDSAAHSAAQAGMRTRGRTVQETQALCSGAQERKEQATSPTTITNTIRPAGPLPVSRYSLTREDVSSCAFFNRSSRVSVSWMSASLSSGSGAPFFRSFCLRFSCAWRSAAACAWAAWPRSSLPRLLRLAAGAPSSSCTTLTQPDSLQGCEVRDVVYKEE